MSVYVDTSAFYAIIDQADSKHQSAVSTWRNLLLQNETLTTSSYVVTEIVALLHNRFGTDIVRRFVEDNLPAVQIRWIDQQTHDAAMNAMLANPGKNGPSLTDCANLEIMRQNHTNTIFAHDQHFANLGLNVVG